MFKTMQFLLAFRDFAAWFTHKLFHNYNYNYIISKTFSLIYCKNFPFLLTFV